jgi:nucleotide-binding universal stress UspA family protein
MAPMIEIKRSLCPIDFSDCSRHALEHAVVLARWYESTITVFHAFAIPMTPVSLADYPVLVDPASITPPKEVHEQVVSDLKRFADTVPSSGISLNFEARPGRSAQGILAEAAALPADLIVMGTHGRGGLDRLVLGSVTEKVLRKASCPVLTVPPPVSGAPAAARVLFERILCPLDFSESSLYALTYALSLAQEADAQLLLLHVLEGLPEPNLETYRQVDLSTYEETRAQAARERLQRAIPNEARTWCRPEELLATGKAYREILRVARERDVHLIVMGVQGRNPVDLMLFGSTTHHVVRGATCPVLTLRS